MAIWTKRSIFFWSLIGIHSPMSSLPSALVPGGTWPATLQGRSLVSKDWIAPMPDSRVHQAPPDVLNAQAQGTGDAHAGHDHTAHGGSFSRVPDPAYLFCFSM